MSFCANAMLLSESLTEISQRSTPISVMRFRQSLSAISTPPLQMLPGISISTPRLGRWRLITFLLRPKTWAHAN